MPDDSNIFDIIRDLQPIAFLLSMCLIIAGFFSNPLNEIPGINLTNILMASLFFFFAYIGMFIFKMTKYPMFRYFGGFSFGLGWLFIFNAFGGIAGKIDDAAIPINGIYIAFLSLSLFLIGIIYLLGKIKTGIIRDLCKLFFQISFISFCLCLVLSVVNTMFKVPTLILNLIYNISFITMVISLLPLSALYGFVQPNLQMRDSYKELKTDIFSLNPMLSLRVIIPSIIGTWLLIDIPDLILGVKIGLIAILILIFLFITGFCLTWYKEIIGTSDKSEDLMKSKNQAESENVCVEPKD